MAKKYYETGTNVSAVTYTVYTGRCLYHGFRLGMDATNDVTLYLSDGSSKIVPTNQFDASLLGLNGEILSDQAAITCETGITVTVTCSGTFEIVIVYNPLL